MVCYRYPCRLNGSDNPSLVIGMTAIAESTMDFINTLLALKLHATICGVSDLCVVQCCLLLDLLLDEVECVHCSAPKEMRINLLCRGRIRFPVPSVVCVLCFCRKALWISMLHPMKEDIKLLGGSEKSCLFNSLFQPFIIFAPKVILRWDMTKKDEC